mgnify:CR=1 FL=1
MLKRLFFLLFPVSVYAQTEIPLNDLSQFQKPSANWSIEGQIVGTPQGEALVTTPGKGILVNTLKAAKYQRTDDLVFALEHGDIRLSLDYMIPKGSNSGIYLQSRYEIQILDSWLKLRPSDGDAGAIYHRWDESRGAGKEGYEGHPPRQNAIKAPGLWNHIEIDFQAPKFDANGKKIAKERNCGRLEWSVLDWNTPSIEFYKSLGAKPMDEWTVFRLDKDGIENLAK